MSRQSKIQKSALNSNSQPIRRSIFKTRGFNLQTKENESISTTGATVDYSKVDFGPRALLQPKLTVGAPGDKYEQEADNMAAQVMSMPDAAVQREMAPEEQKEEEVQTKPLAAGITPLVQREAMPEEEEVQAKPLSNTTIQREAALEEEIQTKPISASIQRETSPEEEEVQTKPSLQRATDGSFQAGSNIESQLNNSKGGGSPLSDEVRGFMEPRFGTDFSSVRVHTGNEAVQMNRELGAQAFTHGSDVYFGTGKAPGNNELMAHELTHVVQQAGGVHPKCSACEQKKKIEEPQIQTTLGTYVQRVHTDENGRKKFDNQDYIGDSKLEDCLNDEDRLRPFETGSSVTAVQQGLQKDGGDLGEDGTKGVYGAATGKAVKAFKRKYGLGFTQFPDVGPGTMKKLDELGTGNTEECPPCSTSTSRPPNCPPCPPILPEPANPNIPPGPVKPPGSVLEFCVPFLDRSEALIAHPLITDSVLVFAAKFGSEVQNLYFKYMTNPKSGTKGTLPPRQVFGDQQSRVVKEFRQDPETKRETTLILKLLADRVRSDPKLMPLPGQSTPLLNFRPVLKDSELLDRQMSFGDPANRIPGFIAGGSGKDASDAGDDVRNVDGKFIATNLGSSMLKIRAAFIFDVFDCVDFCPGNSGRGIALGLTIPISKLEATPDVPTYDVPFEVVYGLSDDLID